MQKIIAFLLIAGFLTGALGCNKKLEELKPPVKTELQIGVIPQQNSGKMKEAMDKLAEYLSARLGLKAIIQVAPDYASVVDGMNKGQIDLAYFGPFTYLVAHERSGAQALAANLINGEASYKSLIISRKDSAVNTLADLKGKVFAFGDPGSASGYIIPASMLRKSGLEGSFSAIYPGGHEATAMSVLDKKADAGAIDSVIFSLLIKKGTIKPEDFRIVSESEYLYEYPWAVRKDLEPKFRESLLNAFLDIHDPKILEPFGVSGYAAADDSKYDNLRQAAKELNIDLTSFVVTKRY